MEIDPQPMQVLVPVLPLYRNQSIDLYSNTGTGT